MEKKSGNGNLKKANKAKNDEFYTQLSDIEKELGHYKQHFKGKTIFCNCDDPEESNFFKYFALNFEHLGLKKLVTTHYQEEIPSYKLEITRGLDLNNDGKVDLSDTKKIKLKQNGDFRSPECIEILKESDIIITNPPFSLFREYVVQLMEYDKKFVIIGNKNAITYKEIFKILKINKIWLGYTSASEFCDINGNITKKINGLTRWFTNLDIKKRYEELILYKYYNEKNYPKYYNFDAINIDKVKDIPKDYSGYIGVPITFLDKYNPEQFEIIGLAADKREIDSAFIQGEQTYLDERHKKFVGMVTKENGILKATYARIIIKNKKFNP
ncbi:MAG: adenine-specific methyltransferase EcoRI family protein [Candidatus Gracilibacteria bacterium]|nr:adenine-specific methyltransferase EcoRI family protein [Candidatus Gracilibacteria bacterium]